VDSIVDSLESALLTIMLTELFSLRVRLRRGTSEYRFKIGDFSPTGPVDLKFQVEEVAPTNHSVSQKSTLNDLSYGVKIWTDFSSVLSQFMRLTDRQADTFLATRPPCIQCSAVTSIFLQVRTGIVTAVY